MPSQNPSISHARFKGARICGTGASEIVLACVLQPSAFVQTSLPLLSALLPPLFHTHTFDSTFLHLFFFLTFYCSNIICFWKLHIFIMYFKWCPCPLVGIVATFVALFACFGCRVRANFDWDILLSGLCFCRRRHTREHLLVVKMDVANELHVAFIMHSRFAQLA